MAVLRGSRNLATIATSMMLIAGTLVVSFSNQSFADSSDVTACSSSFTGTLTSPFNAQNFLTIDGLHGSNSVEFDYAKAVDGDGGITSYLKTTSFDPSNVVFTEKEVISMVVENHGGFFGGNLITLYRNDVSDCDILFHQSTIPAAKKMPVQVLSITEQAPLTDIFIIKALIPDKAAAGTDFTKLVVVYDDSDESAVWYTIPNIQVVSSEASECINSFNGTKTSPFFADSLLRISAKQGTYDLDFDYSRIFDDGDLADGWAYFINPQTRDPQATFVGGETISFTIKSNGQGGITAGDDVATLYASDVSDCDILYNPDSIPSNKKLELDSTSVTNLGDGHYLHKVLIPQKDAISDSFTKFFVTYGDDDESNVYYSLPGVKIVGPDTIPPSITAPAAKTLNANSQTTNICQNIIPSSISANGNDGNIPQNAIDNNLATRWSNLGIGSSITEDLGAKKVICNVEIAWYSGNTRTNNLVVSVSDDGTIFKPVFTGKSSGTTLQQEKYEFADSVGRYVKITVNGNSANNWASITELDANGYTSLGFPTVADNIDKSPLVSNNAPAAGFKLGTTAVTWTAIDASGNTASATQQVVLADKTLPVMAFTSPTNGATINGPTSGVVVQIKGTASDVGLGVQKVEIRTKDPDGLLSSYVVATPKSANDWSSWSTSKTLTKSGTYSIYGKVTDKAGNQKFVSISIIVKLGADTLKPSVKITSPANGATVSGPSSGVNVKVVGTASDSGSGIQKVEARWIGSGVSSSYSLATPSSPGNWSTWSQTLSLTASGTYTITARATDKAGNLQWSTISIKIVLS